MSERGPKINPYPFLSPTIVEFTLTKNPFEKVSNIVAKELENAIIRSKFSPGQRLNISQIAEAMGVSPTPVWEAIEQLQIIGLVVAEAIPNSRRNIYRVFEMSMPDIEDFFLTRAALEGLAVKICATKSWNVDLNKLKQHAIIFHDELYRYATAEIPDADPVAFSEIDQAFHLMLINSTHNRFLIESYNALEKITSFFSIKTSYYMSLQLNRDDALTLGNQHMAIYRAIESNDADLAEHLMQSHISFCANHYLRNLNLERIR